jgi:hypothetical protein
MVGSAHPKYFCLVMLSEAKHLVFKDSSVASGSLRMTEEIDWDPLVGA